MSDEQKRKRYDDVIDIMTRNERNGRRTSRSDITRNTGMTGKQANGIFDRMITDLLIIRIGSGTNTRYRLTDIGRNYSPDDDVIPFDRRNRLPDDDE